MVAAARLIVACLLQARRGDESWPGRRFGATHIEFGLAAVVLAAVRAAAARSAGGGGLAHAHLTAVLERALRRVRCAQNLDGTEPSRKVVSERHMDGRHRQAAYLRAKGDGSFTDSTSSEATSTLSGNFLL